MLKYSQNILVLDLILGKGTHILQEAVQLHGSHPVIGAGLYPVDPAVVMT